MTGVQTCALPILDIQLVVMDGMETAKKIRKLDENVILIFITNMAQYAIQGYEVNALDYVLKPVSYFAFSQELDKAVKKIKLRKGNSLLLLQDKGVVRLNFCRRKKCSSSRNLSFGR